MTALPRLYDFFLRQHFHWAELEISCHQRIFRHSAIQTGYVAFNYKYPRFPKHKWYYNVLTKVSVEKLSWSKNDLGRKNFKNNNSCSSCCIFFLFSCCLVPHSFVCSSSEHCHTTPALTQTHPRPQPGSVCLPSLNSYIFSSAAPTSPFTHGLKAE